MRIDKLIEHIGGAEVVAAACGVTRQAVLQWRRVPAGHVIPLAENAPIAITPHEIRADLYPHPLDGLRLRGLRKKLNGRRRAR